MNKLIILGLAATVGAAYTAMQGNPAVELQPASPGTAQTGNLNVSGTVISGVLRAGTVFGNSVSPSGAASGGDFRSASTSGRGVFGFASATNGLTYGGMFQNASSTGRAVFGLATATSSANYGGFFQSAGVGGRGVLGLSTSATGTTFGGHFTSVSSSGRGVYGNASATTGLSYGVYGQSASADGRAVFGLASSTNGFNYGGLFQSDSSSGTGVFGYAGATSGITYAGYFQSQSTSGTAAYGYASPVSGQTFGVRGRVNSPDGYAGFFEGRGHFAGNVGIGIQNPSSRLHVEGNGSDAMLVNNTGGGRGATINAQTDTGLWAITQSGFAGIDARNNGTSGYGIYALMNSGTGGTVGMWAQSASTGGTGVVGFASAASGATTGGHFRSDSNGGQGVYGWATALIGTTYGGHFLSASSGGRGVFGEATSFNTNGFTYGVYGTAASANGKGVFGRTTSTIGSAVGVHGVSDSTGGHGVLGYCAATSGTNYGVYGGTDSTQNGWGVFAQGNLGASGGKAFRIDHPFDPENKYLLHYSAEGPDVLNIYTGNTVTDNAGYATIKLPDYFDEINKDPRYTLTAIDSSDDFVLAKVSQEVRNNQFVIRTNKPSVKVSWEVKAIRNDRWMRKYGAPVEVEKEGLEKGTYQHPELFGLGPERGMKYDLMNNKTRNPVPDAPATRAIAKH